MTNRLSASSSPYLRQHQNNPVDWYPWCEEAFDRARQEDRPIFLSVGYSACHWCHVMEHESFENEEIAAILNQRFVSIKVDREERPDVDQIYMQAVQMLTGSGGWPMSVFMDSDGRPFFGGTYWPPDSRWGRPGFGQVLLAIVDAWQNKRDQLSEQGDQIVGHLEAACRGPEAIAGEWQIDWLTTAVEWLVEHHDAQHGGFGGAPKFPHAMDLALLIEYCRNQPDSRIASVVHRTLDKMARGGIYDHLGGGFARYSVDARWLVPHFEKMLYDNALLAGVYADAWRLWQHPPYERVVLETLDYVIRDMTNPSGGYYSTEDADSEGVEGKFYVWSHSEVQDLLGAERGPAFCRTYDVTEQGNFEGANILNLPQPWESVADELGIEHKTFSAQLDHDRARLFSEREKRIRPGLDDKTLLSWNSLMISAMVRGYRATGEDRFLTSAQSAFRFVMKEMRRADGTFWHTWRANQPSLQAYLDDYGYWLEALTDLFQVDCTVEVLMVAIDVAEILLKDFGDPEGGFFFTANSHETLIARSKDLADSSVPSGNAMAASGLLTLARITDRPEFTNAAESALRACSGVMASSPQAAGQALRVLHRIMAPTAEWILCIDENDPKSKLLTQRLLQPLTHNTLALVSVGQVSGELSSQCPHFDNRGPIDGKTTLYVCKESTCGPPLHGKQIQEFLAALK